MSRAGIVRLIAEREISERLQGRVIRVTTAITALLVVAGIIVPGLIKGSSAPTRIGLVGAQAQALAPTLERSASEARIRISVNDVADAALARAEVTSRQLDVALSLSPSLTTSRVEVKETLSPTIRSLLAATVDQAHLDASLVQAGVPLAKVLPALAPVPLTTVALQPPPSDQIARQVAAIAAGLLMYIALVFYGGAVANGVAQEKTSRTAEVLLAAVRPSQLLAGKVIGIGLTGLGQLAIAAGAGLIANAIVQSAKIPASIWALLPAFLAFFLAGFVLYAFAFAAAGALVSRQEEVQSVTVPIAMPLLVGYLLVYVAIGSPNATWLRVLSFVPPLSATLMPARIALGHIAWWELPLCALLMLVSIYVVARLASRIYASGLLRSGPRMSWRSALRARS